MLRGFTRNFKPLEILTEEQVESIHRGTLDVLEMTGVKVEHEGALKLFADHGCKADFDERRVRIPGWLVEDCLRRCPSSFAVKARDPKNNVRIGGNALYFENSIGMRTVDLDTWEPRPATVSEQREGVKVLDALDNLHLVNAYTPYSEIEGIPPRMTMLESLASRIRNSAKCQAASYFNDSEIFAIKVAKAVGMDLVGTITASPPLTYYEDATEAIFRFVEAGFPISVASGAVMGGSGPVTIAGATITNNAELMGGIVLAQLIRPGVGIQVSDSVYPMDMQRGQPAFGALGAALHNVVFNQMWRSYRIPTCSWIAGITSAKKIDFQCAYERAMTALLCALSGSNLISLHGAIYGELTWHPMQAVLDDDIAGWIGHSIEGVEVTDETLAIDLIEEVGPIPGHYLHKEHTRKWWKREQFIPKVAERESYPEWIKKGKKDALALARERLEEILDTHNVTPLTQDQDRAIDGILEEARSYYKKR
jgi:trimethylamine--corrinoid protein Co-methyltransferase